MIVIFFSGDRLCGGMLQRSNGSGRLWLIFPSILWYIVLFKVLSLSQECIILFLRIFILCGLNAVSLMVETGCGYSNNKEIEAGATQIRRIVSSLPYSGFNWIHLLSSFFQPSSRSQAGLAYRDRFCHLVQIKFMI